MSSSKPIWTGLAVGVVVGGAFFLLLFFTVFSICSTTSLAEGLFPYALISDPTLHDRWWLALPLALVQYPAYGMLCGFVWLRKRSVLWVVVLGLVVAHAMAGNAASARMKSLHEKMSLAAESLSDIKSKSN